MDDAGFHTAMCQVVPWLDQRARASLAAVSHTCRTCTLARCPYTSVTLTLPPKEGCWPDLHAHGVTDTLVIRHRSGTTILAFVIAVHRALDALDGGGCWPRRVEVVTGANEVECLLAPSPVSSVLGRIACRAREVAYVAPTALEGDLELMLHPHVERVDLHANFASLRFTGQAPALHTLAIRCARPVWNVAPPETGWPALQQATLNNVCFINALRDSAPRLRALTLGDTGGDWGDGWPVRVTDDPEGMLWQFLTERAELDVTVGLTQEPRMVVGLPATSATLLAPFDWAWFDFERSVLCRTLRVLELDMGLRGSDDFPFATLACMRRLTTLKLRRVRRLSSLDNLVVWALDPPPALQTIHASVDVEGAVDNPHSIARYLTDLATLHSAAVIVTYL